MSVRKRLAATATIAALTVIYFAAGKLGLTLAHVHPNATAVWPPTGITLAALLILGVRVWPGIFLGAFLVNLLTAGTVATSVAIAIGNTLEGLLAAALVRRFAHGRRALEQPADIFKFIGLAAIASTMVSATVGVTSLALAGFAPWQGFRTIWLTWWLGDMGGALLVAPVLLLWSLPLQLPSGRGRWLEVVLLALSVCLAAGIVFGGWVTMSRDHYPVAFLTMPPVLWAALRFGQRGAAIASLVLASIALWGTLHGFGPFAAGIPGDSLVVLQAFLGVVSAVGLVTGALVSDRQRALRRAGRARVEAEAANRFKDEFLAVASHELRNPLSVILGYANLLEHTQGLPDFVHEAATAIRRNAQTQAQVVSDLLDLSRLQTGKLRLQRQLLALAPLVREAAGAMQLEADAKGVRLGLDLEERPCIVEADSVRLQQIIWNLVHNAIKFTPLGGSIWLRLRVEADAAKLVVEDTGSGIPPDFLPHIFDMFRQADASRTRRYGGMGIGLALVRQLATLHGGRVEAASEGAGHGASFTVSLPIQAGAVSIAPPSAAPAAPERALAGLRVLVVDDTQDVAEMLGSMLQQQGAAVVLATSAAAALQRSEESTFDVVVSDVSMPEMDGCELLRELRRRPRTAALPAIALTGFGRPMEIEATRVAGFALHLVKPVRLEELVDAVRQVSAPLGRAPSAARGD